LIANVILCIADSDISKDGIYSGIFYPEANGIYEVDFHAVHGSSAKGSNRLLNSDQSKFQILVNGKKYL
jgi:hypothetical protein